VQALDLEGPELGNMLHRVTLSKPIPTQTSIRWSRYLVSLPYRVESSTILTVQCRIRSPKRSLSTTVALVSAPVGEGNSDGSVGPLSYLITIWWDTVTKVYYSFTHPHRRAGHLVRSLLPKKACRTQRKAHCDLAAPAERAAKFTCGGLTVLEDPSFSAGIHWRHAVNRTLDFFRVKVLFHGN
jgi:hypothetical protein